MASANDTDDTDDTDKAAALNAAQITELLAMLTRGADRMLLPHMRGAPIFSGTNVTGTAFLKKYESLARSTNCDVAAGDVIDHFPYYCTREVREMVLMLPAYAYCNSEA